MFGVVLLLLFGMVLVLLIDMVEVLVRGAGGVVFGVIVAVVDVGVIPGVVTAISVGGCGVDVVVACMVAAVAGVTHIAGVAVVDTAVLILLYFGVSLLLLVVFVLLRLVSLMLQLTLPMSLWSVVSVIHLCVCCYDRCC